MIVAMIMYHTSESWSLDAALESVGRYCQGVVLCCHEPKRGVADDKGEVRRIDGSSVGIIFQDEKWMEMKFRQAMLEQARLMGATHMAIVDADEFATDDLCRNVPDIVANLDHGEIACPRMISPWEGLDYKRVDNGFGSSWISWLFRDNKNLCYRTPSDGYQWHSRAPSGTHPKQLPDSLGQIVHLQYASLRRLRVKAAYYKMIETIYNPGRKTPEELNRMYDWTLRGTPQLQPMPDTTYYARQLVDLKTEPWQAEAAQSLYLAYGPEKFVGLNLHGVVGQNAG